MKEIDIEQLNRHNFKALMNALSMPGKRYTLKSFHNSHLLALANCLLYSEVSYSYEGKEEFSLIDAMTNAKKEIHDNADYIFEDRLNLQALKCAKTGTTKEPDFSALLVFRCGDFEGLKVRLSGPGIKEYTDTTIPANEHFCKLFAEKNMQYPCGNEVLFLSNKGELLALSRTTQVKVL